MEVTANDIATRRDEHESWLREQAFFEGTGIASDDDGKPCLAILVNVDPSEEQVKKIAAAFDGIPYFLKVTGRMQALEDIEPGDENTETD